MSSNPAIRPGRTRWYRVFVLLEWLVVVWLTLELFEATRAYVAERAYQAYFQEQNSKVYRMVPAETLKAPENQFVMPAQSLPRAVLGDAAPAAAIPPEEQEDSTLVRTLRGEMRALFSRRGELLESDGEPMLEQDLLGHMAGIPGNEVWPRVLAAIHQGDDHFEAHVTLTLGIPVHYRLNMRPLPEDPEVMEVVARDISATMPIETRHYGDVPGPDSAWKIMFHSYKPHWEMPGEMLQTNNFGFRDHDVTVPKPDGVFRIVCIGGSTTEEGNSTDETYPKILERKLAQRFGEGRVEVINAGICAINTYLIRGRIDDYLAMEPDLLLFYGGVNDTAHLHFKLWLARVPRWKRVLRHSFLARRWFGFELLPDAAFLEDYMGNTTLRNLRAIGLAARRRGAELAICSFAYPRLGWGDMRARNYYDVNMRDVWQGQGAINFRAYCRVIDLLNRLYREYCTREGIPYFPIAEHFHAGADHFFDICHMTPLGLELKTNIFAGFVGAYLEKIGVTPVFDHGE